MRKQWGCHVSKDLSKTTKSYDQESLSTIISFALKHLHFMENLVPSNI